MPQRIFYDLSRLALRLSRPVPSGIDRLDLLWARTVFNGDGAASGIVTGALGQRVVPKSTALAILDAAGERWDVNAVGSADPVFERVRSWLVGRAKETPAPPAPSNIRETAATALKLVRKTRLGRDGLFPGRSPSQTIPRDATYINVSQFPLALPWLSRWLDRRPDLDSMIMIHDMLPITHPEFFPPRECQQHVRLLDRATHVGRVLVVTGEDVKLALGRYIAERDLPRRRIAVVPPPLDPIFHEPSEPDPELHHRPYFIVCGTIEPRKNHLFLLHIWRELAAELGPDTPKLVIIGARGWECENVVDLLERSGHIRAHVREISGLGTHGLKKLMDNCRALLMPTFAEGYGLPVAEALAMGVPVITSSVPSLADANVRNDAMVLDPIDGTQWKAAIKASANGPFPTARTKQICPDIGNTCPGQHIAKFIFDRP